MQGYTRPQAVRLSGLSDSKLRYLDSLGLVSPHKQGNPKKPTCTYSWEQIIQLRTIYKLRKDATMQQVRKALETLNNLKINPSIYSNCLVATGNDIFFIPNNELEVNKMVIQLNGKHPDFWGVASITTVAITDVVSDICKLADENKIILKERTIIESIAS